MKKRIIISAISAVLLGLVTSFIYDGIKDLPWLSSVKIFFVWIWESILCAEFKVWQIVIFVLVLVVLFVAIAKIKKPKIIEPGFKKYTKDRIAGYTWTWRWVWNPKQNAYNVSSIQPFCPQCETPMHYNYAYHDRYDADCPRCEYSKHDIKSLKDIEVLILDNSNRNRDI